MSTPMQYYRSLPPVAKTYAVACLMTTGAFHLELYDLQNIALFYDDVLKRFQVWRLITNFFFIGPFSLTFAFRLLIILRYGVSLERGPFDKRTADYLWMYIVGAFSLLIITVIPYLRSPLMGASLVFMIVYVWGREFPNERIDFHGLVQFKGFYLPWTMLVVDLLIGNPLMPDILGIVAGHIYYFLTVLYPLSSGRNPCKTPLWVHRVVAYWGEGFQMNSPVRAEQLAGIAFRGRSYRLDGSRTNTTATAGSSGSGSGSGSGSHPPSPLTSNEAEAQTNDNSTSAQSNGVAFRGRSYRLNDR